MRAQGTIEYLVILAVIVVVALVVVTLMVSTTRSGAGVTSGVSQLHTGTTPIAVTEIVSSPNDGNTYLRVANSTGENATIKMIQVGDDSGSFDSQNLLPPGAAAMFSIQLSSPCTSDEDIVLDVVITYETDAGLEKKQVWGQPVTISCEPVAPVEIPVFASDGGGGGTGIAYFDSCWSDVADPHPVCNCFDLNRMRTQMTWDYQVQNDINFGVPECAAFTTGVGFVPIGKVIGTKFSGDFDGQNHKITNFYINAPSASSGVSLFGFTEGSAISDVNMVDVNISLSSGNYAGGIAGVTSAGDTISNVHVTGTILHNGNSGGLVGQSNATITNSSFEGTVAGTYGVAGGLVGSNRGPVYNSYSTGVVQGNGNWVGGLCGYSRSSITNSYSLSDVNGDSFVGGLVGNMYDESIVNSYATGDVYNDSYHTGGLVGGLYSGASTVNSYATGTVTGALDRVGGLIGSASDASITGSYATGEVSGNAVVAGLIGYRMGTVTITDNYWYNSESDCHDGGSAGCTKAPGVASFYNFSYGVYSPWTFGAYGADANWDNTCNSTGYPTLQYENISVSGCRT